MEIATTDYRHPTPGWTTWHSDSPHLTGAVDGLAHLDISATHRRQLPA